jgi:carboxymethylenebutenolidase
LFAAAKVPAEVEAYRGTIHGWCVPDTPLDNGKPIYNKPDAERAQAAGAVQTALA